MRLVAAKIGQTMPSYLIAFSTLAICVGAAAQTIPELARSKPPNPVVRGVMGDTPALPLADLVRGADVAVQAKISLVKSYLTPNEMYILTEYQVAPELVLAGQPGQPLLKPRGTPALTLVVRGGGYTVDGFTVYDVDHTREPLKDGARYLLFLKRTDDKTGRYTLFSAGAFQLGDDQLLKPTLKGAESVVQGLGFQAFQGSSCGHRTTC